MSNCLMKDLTAPSSRDKIRPYSLTVCFMKPGQEVGAIRTGIPGELIFAWLQALDEASDQWLLVRWRRTLYTTKGSCYE
jgi:hypothetical protein